MILFKIEHTDLGRNGQTYDTYDSAVIAAATDEKVRAVAVAELDDDGDPYRWADPTCTRVTHLGVAHARTKSGVVLASFNAG